MNSYTIGTSELSTGNHSVISAACSPQVLPSNLQPLYNVIESLSQKFGFAFAKTEWFASRLGFSITHINRLLRKLVALGRIVIEEVVGSHDRRFYPVPLPASFFSPKKCRKGSEDGRKTRGTFRNYSPLGERQVTCADAIPVPVSATLEEEENAGTQAQAVEPSPSRDSSGPKSEKSIAAQLLSRGVWPQTVPWIVTNVPEKQIIRAIEYFDIVQAFRKIEKPGAYLKGLAVSGAANGLDMSQVGVKAKPEGIRRIESVRAPRPDKSTMYHQFTEAELNGEDVPVKAVPRPLGASVGVPEQDLDKLPAALAERLRRRREEVK